MIDKPETLASAIRIGNPASWQQARAAIVESHGAIDVVTMRKFWLHRGGWHSMKEFLSSRPARRRSPAFSNGAIPAMRIRSKKFGKPVGSFATVTGHGLKDPDVVIGQIRELKPIAATVADVRSAIEL